MSTLEGRQSLCSAGKKKKVIYKGTNIMITTYQLALASVPGPTIARGEPGYEAKMALLQALASNQIPYSWKT